MRKAIVHRMTRANRRRFYTRLANVERNCRYLEEMAYIDRTGFGYYL